MFILSVPHKIPLMKMYSVGLNMIIVLFCTVTIFKALKLVRHCNSHKFCRTLGDEIRKCMFSYPAEPQLGAKRSLQTLRLFSYVTM